MYIATSSEYSAETFSTKKKVSSRERCPHERAVPSFEPLSEPQRSDVRGVQSNQDKTPLTVLNIPLVHWDP